MKQLDIYECKSEEYMNVKARALLSGGQNYRKASGRAMYYLLGRAS
jgi:hypothetical protein